MEEVTPRPRVTVYLTELDWAADLAAMEHLVTELSEASTIIASVDSWWPSYREFVTEELGEGLPQDQAAFDRILTQFLYR